MKAVLLMAITLDGKIAKHTTHPATWTSKADKKVFIEATKNAGVIIMGQTTYDTIGRPLPGRLNVVMNPEPDRTKNIPDTLEFTNTQPSELLKELEARGFSTVIVGGGSTINGLFLSQGLLDEVWLTIEPRLFGEGLSLFRGADVDISLQLIEVKKLDENVLQVKYKIIK
ncbi:MAG TPA: dihydrofolate reductase [Candidatus Magasanikbacteria bacterium]|nr:dihydrofolate reductase [Candidatus Magasanikbacteria bacterium]